MSMQAKTFQVRRERSLRQQLDENRSVGKAVKRVSEIYSGRGFGYRRNLLSSALRLTKSMSPEITESMSKCRELLGIQEPIEIFVRPDPLFNACIIPTKGGGPLTVVLSSRLVECFSPAELRFVIGHELGHATLDHFGIPMPITAYLEEGGVPYVNRTTALDLYAWSRLAELSADRVGLVCAQDPDAAASGFFKLASGTATPRVQPDLEAYAQQVDSLASAPAAREKLNEKDDSLDCFDTHPYSPVRVRALYAFSRSRGYREAIGQDPSGHLTEEALEAMVEKDMALMEPGYLEENDAVSEALRRLLYTSGVLMAAADGQVEDCELEVLSALLGASKVGTAPNLETATKDLDGRVEEAVKVAPVAKRAQVLQHLALIAAADGEIHEKEMLLLEQLSERLGVPMEVVHQTLHASVCPMD